MNKLLTAGAFRVFATVFFPFLIVVGTLMFMSFSGLWNNQVAMFIGPFYVYPQLFMLIYWLTFVSTEITQKTEPELQHDLKRLNKFFGISKVILALCLVFSVGTTLLFNLELSDTMNNVVSGVSMVFAIAQLFAFFNWIYAFYKLSRVLSTYEHRDQSADYSGTIITFFFMPLTIGIIQGRIRKIFEN